MKKIIYFICITVLFISCTNNPTIDPARTQAKAAQDQARFLDSINQTLKRIADKLK